MSLRKESSQMLIGGKLIDLPGNISDVYLRWCCYLHAPLLPCLFCFKHNNYSKRYYLHIFWYKPQLMATVVSVVSMAGFAVFLLTSYPIYRKNRLTIFLNINMYMDIRGFSFHPTIYPPSYLLTCISRMQ